MTIMKDKLMIMLAMLTMVIAFTACGEKNEDDPEWKKKDVVFAPEMLNHVYCYGGTSHDLGEIQIAKGVQKLTFHRQTETADIVLSPAVPMLAGKTYTLTGLKLKKDADTGRYTYQNEAPVAGISLFYMVLDFNEQSMQMSYRVNDAYQVNTHMQEFAFANNSSILSYSNGKASEDKEGIYIFTIDPSTKTATMKIAPLTNTEMLMRFHSIEISGIDVELTQKGYELTATKPRVVSRYLRYNTTDGTDVKVDAPDTSGHQLFPVKNFNSIVWVTGNHVTEFKMGSVEEGTKPFDVHAVGELYKEHLFE